jgi:hypothetical protein
MVQFAVTLKDAEWTVFENGKIVAQGMSRSRAIEQAHDLTRRAAEDGEAVELLVQDYMGMLTTRRAM